MGKLEKQLSAKSSNFLGDLRVYLLSSGKDEKEVEDIVQELEVHLIEAEEKGKSVEQVIGQSPGEYMARISKEMSTDFSSEFKYILLIIFGGFSFSILPDLLKGTLFSPLFHINLLYQMRTFIRRIPFQTLV